MDMDRIGYVCVCGLGVERLSYLGHAVDISMDIMPSHLLIRLTNVMLRLSVCLSVCCSYSSFALLVQSCH